MNKKLILILVSLNGTLSTIAQSISPVETGEFCPIQNITFTVTLPRIVNNTIPNVISFTNTPSVISGATNITHTATQTTFTFVGNFRDVNINQVFKIDYVTSTNPSATYLASFKKIKSLFYPNPVGSSPSSPCQQFRANQTSITAPRCQVTNIPISVIPTNWSTFGEGNDFCWGSITTYEYQLPNGWSIGSNVSTGTNWIAGGASVTVTSNLSNGINGAISIRPRNSCSSGLANNIIPVQIAILRPGPTTITGGVPILCSGSSTYSLNLIPPGATVCWTLSNNSVASIPTSPFCGNSVTVTRIGSGNANTILTANISDCSGTYPPISFPIAVGTPGNVSLQVNESAFDFCNTGLMQFDASLENPSTTTTLQWSVSGNGAKIKFSATGYTPVLQIKTFGTFEIFGTLSNSCGTSNYSSGVLNSADFWSSYCGSYRFSVSPNPVKGNMNIIFDNPIKINENISMRLFSLNSSLIVKQWTLQGGQKQFNLNISDLKSGHYVLEVVVGNSKSSKQVIIE